MRVAVGHPVVDVANLNCRVVAIHAIGRILVLVGHFAVAQSGGVVRQTDPGAHCLGAADRLCATSPDADSVAASDAPVPDADAPAPAVLDSGVVHHRVAADRFGAMSPDAAARLVLVPPGVVAVRLVVADHFYAIDPHVVDAAVVQTDVVAPELVVANWLVVAPVRVAGPHLDGVPGALAVAPLAEPDRPCHDVLLAGRGLGPDPVR